MTQGNWPASPIPGIGLAEIGDEICHLFEIARSNDRDVSRSVFPRSSQSVSDLNDARGLIVTNALKGGPVTVPNRLIDVVFKNGKGITVFIPANDLGTSAARHLEHVHLFNGAPGRQPPAGYDRLIAQLSGSFLQSRGPPIVVCQQNLLCLFWALSNSSK